MATEKPGEGNRAADRRYRAGAESFTKSGDVEARAREAKVAYDHDPTLAQAEDAGVNRAKEFDPEVEREGLGKDPYPPSGPELSTTNARQAVNRGSRYVLAAALVAIVAAFAVAWLATGA